MISKWPGGLRSRPHGEVTSSIALADPALGTAGSDEHLPGCQNHRMAVHHPAKIVPGKLELLQAWVPHQPWTGGTDTSTLARLGSYRFDDPAGQVGIETHLLGTADGQVLQVSIAGDGRSAQRS